MAFSRDEWEHLYASGRHDIHWPWSNIISYIYRYAKPVERQISILELGCGIGTNIPFFRTLEGDYRGLDGSANAVEKAKTNFPDWADKIAVSDFTTEIPFEGPFDVVIERASLSHNPTADIKRCLDLVGDRLKPGGLFIGLDWFSTKHTEYNEGRELGDRFTRTGYGENSYAFANAGTIHFSDEQHLRELFENFDIEVLQHNERQHIFPQPGYTLATWDIVARAAV